MSPQMHNFYAERTGLNLAYVPFRVEPQAVGDAVKGAYALNLLGLNVTVPHKQRVMEYLVEIDEDARAIGAVNTLVRMEGGYKGYNTDAAGLKRAMDRGGTAGRLRQRIDGQGCDPSHGPGGLRPASGDGKGFPVHPVHQRWHASGHGPCRDRG